MDIEVLRHKVWAMLASWELMRFESDGGSWPRDRYESWQEAIAEELDMNTLGFAADKTQEDFEEVLRKAKEAIETAEGDRVKEDAVSEMKPCPHCGALPRLSPASLSFTLTMPSVGSWDGKWTGEEKLYVRVIDFGKSKKAHAEAKKILDVGYFHYDFGDGWSAGITVKEVSGNEIRGLRAKSAGFCGYEWMIESIRECLEIKVRSRP